MLDLNQLEEAGIVRLGNTYRLAEVIKRAEQKEPLTIGFIGGSITMGSLSSTPETCYAYRVLEWWKAKFPDTEFTYRNAGIGATTSQFGVARVEKDLLRYHPDVVFVEFSVNDEDTLLFQETYEGLIRNLLNDSKKPAVVLIHNVCYDTGKSAERLHSAVGEYYSLPAVSIKQSIYAAIQAGELQEKEITPDHLHPNDEGHMLLARVVTHLLERVNDEKNEARQNQEYQVPEQPLTPNRFWKSTRYQNSEIKPAFNGFTTDLSVQKGITDVFKRGWQAKEIGASITFSLTGRQISLQYKKSVNHPAPVAVAVVDGREETSVRLDANFEETWGDCIFLQDIAMDLEEGSHTLTVTIKEAPDNLACPFYLISVITA